MRMKKYFLLLCCFAFVAIAQADTTTNTDLLEMTLPPTLSHSKVE